MKLSALVLLWATQATASTSGSFNDYVPKLTGTFRQNDKPFEALTDKEIRDKLSTIPVFLITNGEGNLVAIGTGPGDELASYAFLAHDVADAVRSNLQKQQPAGTKPLAVAFAPLGAVWESLAAAPSTVKRRRPQIRDPRQAGTQLRLVANDADLAAARASAPKKRALGVPWGVVPAFHARGLVRQNNADPKGGSLQPWFLCAADCRDSPLRARSGVGTPKGAPTVESASVPLEISTLGELVAAMKKPSTTNFRRVVFVPSKQSTEYLEKKNKKRKW